MNTGDWHGPGAKASSRRSFRWSALLWNLVWPQNGHRVIPTRSGTALIGLSLGIGVAAYNTGNNILFITLSLLLAGLVLSGLLSWLNLRSVSWRLQSAPSLRAGQETLVFLELRNDKPSLPVYGLWFDLVASLVPSDPRPAQTTGIAQKEKKRPVRDILAAAEKRRTRQRLFLRGRLDPKSEIRLEWVFLPSQRGRQRFVLEGVGSLFPFGFLKKQAGSTLRHEVMVWPAPVAYRRWGVVAVRPQFAGARVARAGSSGDLLALRKYAPGDSHRLIHWKASARSRQLLVQQFTAENQEVFAMWLQTPADVWTRADQFELLLGFAATLAEDLFRTGKLATVALNRGQPRPVRRVRDLEAFLDELAILQPGEVGNELIFLRRDAAGTDDSPSIASGRKNVITFVPDGARGVAAYVDGEKTAAA